jgi:Protein of unknown function (DUF3089)
VRRPAIVIAAVALMMPIVVAPGSAAAASDSAPVGGLESTTSAARTVAGSAPSRSRRATVWICRPGMPDNPCEGNLDTTVVAPDGTSSVRPFVPPADPRFDCFYVYPTVSMASRTNAPRRSSPEILFATRAQAAPFQSQCRLFVPAYRQITLAGLASGAFADPGARRIARRDIRDAFDEYLRRYNRGRPFLLLGHSQGAMVLTDVVRSRIDGNRRLRDRMVSAMLIGAGPTLDRGSSRRGTFRHVPPCRSETQARCLVAYNTYGGVPPADALFGRTVSGRRVVCVNPGAPGGGSALLDPIVPVPSAPDAEDVGGFIEFTDSLAARCRSNRASTWLDASLVPGSQLPELAVVPTSGPAWGLHRVDVTLALGDLVRLAAEQAARLTR